MFGYIISFFRFLTFGDAVKDSALAAYGFSPVVLLHMETGLLLGLLNLVVVVIFRVIELRYRMRRDGRAHKGTDEADK